MNRAHSRSRLKNPEAFTPLNLFSTGEQGAWYDPSDMSTLFQDSAGTTPVTAAGQPVGLMRDKSGRSNHAAQVTAAKKPILRNSDGLWWLEFDGIDDFMVATSIDFFPTDKMSIFTAISAESNPATTSISVEISVDPWANNGAFSLGVSNGFAPGTWLRGTSLTNYASLNRSLGVPFIHSANLDIAGASRVTEVIPRINGVTDQAAGGDSPSAGTGNFGIYSLYIGSRGGTSRFLAMKSYGLIVRGSFTGSSSMSATEKYLSTKSGVTL